MDGSFNVKRSPPRPQGSPIITIVISELITFYSRRTNLWPHEKAAGNSVVLLSTLARDCCLFFLLRNQGGSCILVLCSNVNPYHYNYTGLVFWTSFSSLSGFDGQWRIERDCWQKWSKGSVNMEWWARMMMMMIMVMMMVMMMIMVMVMMTMTMMMVNW